MHPKIAHHKAPHHLAALIPALLFVAAILAAGPSSWSTHGPAVGNVHSLALDRAAPATIYAGTDSGVFRSSDTGNSWLGGGLAGHVISALAAGPMSTVYAGTASGGVFKSLDGASTWTTLISESGGFYVAGIAFLQADPAVPSTVYFASTGVGPGGGPIGGLFKSTDGGFSWSQVGVGLPYGVVTALAIDPVDHDFLYAGTSGAGVFRSVDGGATWSRASGALSTTRVTALAIDPTVTTTIYAASDGQGIFKSADSGVTFLAVDSGLSGMRSLGLTLDPRRPSIVYAGLADGGVARSINGAQTWSAINSGLSNLAVVALVIDPAGTVLHAATSGSGVFELWVRDTLSLNASHSFSVSLGARDQRTGRTGGGLPIPVSDIFGYFSIPDLTFNPGNPEVFVKILDGTAINGSFWIWDCPARC